LKAKLFGTAINGHQPMIPMPETYEQQMEKKKARYHIAEK